MMHQLLDGRDHKLSKCDGATFHGCVSICGPCTQEGLSAVDAAIRIGKQVSMSVAPAGSPLNEGHSSSTGGFNGMVGQGLAAIHTQYAARARKYVLFHFLKHASLHLTAGHLRD
jgi:hypothetical protein